MRTRHSFWAPQTVKRVGSDPPYPSCIADYRSNPAPRVTFTKNRDRLLEGEIARAFFEDVVAEARGRRLLSAEHFMIDGTLLEAWAGQKSFKRKDQPHEPPDDPGNPTVNFHGERRSNRTHQSTTDPDSRLFKKAKGHEAKPSWPISGKC